MIGRRSLISLPPLTLLFAASDGQTKEAEKSVKSASDLRHLEERDIVPHSADATLPLNAAIRIAKERGNRSLDLNGAIYYISGRVVVDGVKLTNFRLIFAGKNASVRLTGQSPGIENYQIDYRGYDGRVLHAEGGVVNLHLSSDAFIGKGAIKGMARRVAIKCVSSALRTKIDGLESRASWGVLFDDKNNRTIDAINYKGTSIGNGLHICNSNFYGHPERKNSGDGIEINTPRERFSDIEVRNCVVHQTVSSPSVGLGIAFAGVDNVLVRDCTVQNGTSPAGAYHAEFCKIVRFERSIAKDCYSGMSIGMCEDVEVTECQFLGNWRFSIQSFNTYGDDSPETLGVPTKRFAIKNCIFSGTGTGQNGRSGPDIVVGRTTDLKMIGNTFYLDEENSAPRIRMMTFDSTGVTGVTVGDNRFLAPHSWHGIQIVQFDANTRDVREFGNEFPNAETLIAFQESVKRAK